MPSFLIRGISRYLAASYMARSSRPSSTPEPDEVAEGVSAWNKNMQWLIPFVQATGHRVVVENPKSHEQIVIDKDTKEFPKLSSGWLRRYNKQEVLGWMAQEDEKERLRKKVEKQGRSRFGDSLNVDE